jgi:hypothetical protein
MRDGIYRVQYETATLCATGVIVLNNGELNGCDRFHFMFGDYRQRGNNLTGRVTFKCHTVRTGRPAAIPEQFELICKGVGSDSFGQFNFRCPGTPQIRGRASFTWLADFTPV